jgi:hypothetical protein
MPNAAETIIRLKLDADERLIWSGQPKQGIQLQLADVFFIPVGLFWTTFMIFAAIAIIGQEADLGSKIFGLIVIGLFILFGLFLLGGRLWVDAALRRRTYYAVTDRRIIIISGLLRQKLQSIFLRTLSDITLTETRGGDGTISFGPVPLWYYCWYGLGWPGMGGAFSVSCFRLIDRVREVYNLILQAQRAAS